MNWKVLAVMLMVCVGFAVASVHASAQKSKQAKTGEETAKEKPEDNKSDVGKKSDDKKADEKKDEALDEKGMHELMESIKKSWAKLKINARKNMWANAKKYADELGEHAKKMKGYKAKIKDKDGNEKVIGEQKDYKGWVADFKKYSGEMSKAADKSDKEKFDKAKEKMGETCGACHDIYQPEDDDD